MAQFIAGIDGGGTKTLVEVRPLAGGEPKTAAFGPLNLNGSDRETVKNTIRDCFDFIGEAAMGLNGCLSVAVGSAGINNPESISLLNATIEKAGYNGRLTLVGDHETALAGALGGRDGIVLIAGTGSICYGRAGEMQQRTGGWGHLLDDEGSGYAIGRDILAAVVRELDGRIPKTALTELVFKRIDGRSVRDIIRFAYSGDTGKKGIASLSPLLPVAVAKGDEAALEIVKKCGRELLALARPVVEALGLGEGLISLLGGILTKDMAVREETIRQLRGCYPKIGLVEPELNAAAGAAIIAEKKLSEDENNA